MNRRVSPKAIARIKLVNGVAFAGFGVFILIQTARVTGLDWRGISGYMLGAALIALGVTRFVAWIRR